MAERLFLPGPLLCAPTCRSATFRSRSPADDTTGKFALLDDKVAPTARGSAACRGMLQAELRRTTRRPIASRGIGLFTGCAHLYTRIRIARRGCWGLSPLSDGPRWRRAEAETQ